jgi:hypothetical protein
MMLKIFATILITLLAAACSSGVKTPQPPSWINEPGDGAVGSSVTHVKGKYYQEELAIARARERLAARYGVEISSIETISEKVVNDASYVTSNKQIDQKVKAQTVRAKVRERWYDAAHDELWVWMYPIK